jgi:hypothetical protein
MTVDDRIRKLEIQVSTHEAVCAERYTNINKTMAEMKSATNTTNTWLITVGIALIAGMAKLIFFGH